MSEQKEAVKRDREIVCSTADCGANVLIENKVKIGVAGSVDAGKSTMIGVITYGKLDNGDGSAREKVAKHPHEIELGKTSDISIRSIQYDIEINPKTNQINENEDSDNQDPYSQYNSMRKIVSLVDMCGHEKYLKTTMFGITSSFLDYAIVMVSANRGVLKMSREHLGILLYAEIPTVVIITKVDIAPKNIFKTTRSNLLKILRYKTFNKKAVFINQEYEKATRDLVEELEIKEDAIDNLFNMTPQTFYSLDTPQFTETIKTFCQTNNKNVEQLDDKLNNLVELKQNATKNLEEIVYNMRDNHSVVPVLTVSNKTGYCIDQVNSMISTFRPRPMWKKDDIEGSICYIDSTYVVEGVGLVVSGTLKGQDLGKQNAFVGPIGEQFYPVRIWSLHNNIREKVDTLSDGETGCLAIRFLDKRRRLTRKQIRKGMVIISDLSLTKHACIKFKAEITVLHHSTTISAKYSPVIHVGPVKQTAQIILDRDQKLSTGDCAQVEFRFMFYPEFIEPGMLFFFREGNTKGIGKITGVVPLSEYSYATSQKDGVTDKEKKKNKSTLKKLSSLEII
jgi:elongation factor 1-alpha